jgi:hypothetical protein
MTFAEIRELEPAIAELERRIEAHAREYRSAERYCANQWWYGCSDRDLYGSFRRGGFEFGGFEREMKALVGRSAAKPDLRTSKAYVAAYAHLYGLLPDCRNCGCP